MKYFFAYALFASCVMAFYLAIRNIYHNGCKYLENRVQSIFCVSSAVWSLGFWRLILQTDPDMAHRWRAVGMIGMFAYLITAQILVCHLSGIKKSICIFMEGFSFLGIIIYFFIMQRDQIIYKLEKQGMSYCFKAGIWNNIYTGYTVIVALNLLVVIIYMIRCAKEKRLRVLGIRLLIAEIVIIFGMLLDTVFPLVGIFAIPGSTMGQFAGMVIIYWAVDFINRSRITVTNMSEFIYYSMAMPIFVYDSNRQLQILNDAACNLFEVDRENIQEVRMNSMFTLESAEVFEFEGKSKDVDTLCHNNQLYCSLTINKIYDDYEDMIGYIIFVTDLSERMKYIQSLEEARKEAEYANQAKSTFLANMSHEIRTPMNAIIGFSELVLKMDISPEVRAHVEDIKWSSHNLLAIINDILDISKIESGKMELVLGKYHTSGLLKDVSLIIATQAQAKGLAFQMKADPEIPNRLYGDKIRIRGVLINILNNAVKYTKEGSVSFEVSVLEKTDKKVKLEFKVSDTGVGIRPEEQEHLFKSFEQLDRKVHYGIEGSGLGLAIANGYVQLMGGEIKVSSTYGKGSVFTVILEQEIVDASPMDNDYSHEEEKQNGSTLGIMQISDVQALVVDDNFVNLRVADGIMKSYGLTVDTASSGMEAIELCKNKQYRFVFMDQMMPEMDGVEAMEEIRSISPHYAKGGEGKIIVLTADAISGARKELMKQGFDEYLGKPINLKQMERLFVKFLPKEKITMQQPKEVRKDREQKEEKEINYLKSILSEVDIQKGIENCGGELDDYLKVLKIAWDYGEKQLEELQNLQKQKNYADYTTKVHSMKSTAMNMGAVGLSNMAKEQEMAGKQGNYSYIDAHMELFCQGYRTLLKKIGEVLKNYNMIEEVSETEEMLEEDMILQILENIEKYVDDFDFSRVFQILDEIKKCQMPEKYQQVFGQIGVWMDELEVDKIKELIEKTLEK